MEETTIQTKIYFISDVHLGLPNFQSSIIREKKLVRWLDFVKRDADEIILLGDIFDFWFEYKKVVPRGFSRFLGKISEICDSGIPVHFFTGNHDIWVFDYLEQETGVIVHRGTWKRIINGKSFFIAHGDGLGPFDKKFKLMKSFFVNPLAQWFFARIHPNFSVSLAQLWSGRSRATQTNPKFKGEDKEWLILYAKSVLQKQHFDFFVFGHRHLALEIQLSDKSRFVNLGDWIHNFTYAVFDGKNVSLKRWEE